MPRKKKDLAEKQTDALLDELEKRIVEEYKTALKGVQEKYDRFAARFAEEEKEKKKLFDDGKITFNEFMGWKRSKILSGDKYKQLLNTLASDLAMADQKAMSIANGYMPEAYALNFNYTTYEIEMGVNANTGFALYSRETVEKLVKQNEISLPKRKVDIPLDQQWNRKHLDSAILQGVLQGDSIPKISKRLQQVTDMDRKASIRNARTMMTGAQNGGRMSAYERAANLGIKIQKEWMATLDSRTRDSHQKMDGERVGWKKAFSNGLQYPGDPSGDPAEVYNCRCTMVPFYPDYEYEGISEKRITYKEWAKGKEKEEKTWKKMSEEEYKKWQKENSLENVLKAEAEKRFIDKYGMTFEEAKTFARKTEREEKGLKGLEKLEEMGLADYKYDNYGYRTFRRIEDIINEDYISFMEDIYQVNFSYEHYGYIQCADSSKWINAYLRSGKDKESLRQFRPAEMFSKSFKVTKRAIEKQTEWIEEVEKKISKTIDSLEKLTNIGEIKEDIIVDRWAGINALEFMGLNIEHGESKRIGHAFVTEGIDYVSASKKLKEMIGEKITDNGFMSTSGSSDLNVFRGSDVKFSIKVPKGTKAFVTENVDESEIIFAPGTTQEIEDIRIIDTEAFDYGEKATKRKSIEIVLKIVQK